MKILEKNILPRNRRTQALFVLPFILFSSCNSPEKYWFRGNVHTHSFWSDGQEFPENVARWYKTNGYHFMIFTEGNAIPAGDRWHMLSKRNIILQNYVTDYGREWVEVDSVADEEGNLKVRLKTMEEVRPVYEEPEKFLIMAGNEISNSHGVHLLAFPQEVVIPAIQGDFDEREAMLRQTVKNIGKYRKETGINVHAVLAHPNYSWAITAEMIMNVPELRFFEIYNGHPAVRNEGNETRASVERMWDIVLSKRIISGKGEILYGLASDDAHDYHGGRSGPGRGWIMVNSEELTQEALLDAIDKGNFYSSTGVILKTIRFNGKSIKIEIEPQEGVEYTTEFIGTLKGTSMRSFTTRDEEGEIIENTTRKYSSEIGKILSATRSLNPSYSFSGRELYVRVRITSNADHIDPNTGSIIGKQKAWLQPIIPGMK